ncbi:hypothetical protein HMI54_012760 [Coelomomyces lativittatus]|nr:hypothetical protein HMI54_012760 [Coelomomyces lativittatus]KAJ1499134.1 hypothetical protein HMI55_004566 [Coelomomyces lativittatus]
MNTSNLDLLPGLPCVLPSTSPQHLHQVKEEVYAQLVHVYQLQSQPFLNSYVQHSSQVDPDAFLTTSKKNDFHSNHNNSLTFKKRKKLNHKALEESSSSLYFTTSRNDLGLNTQLKKNKSSPIQHHPQTTRSERGYNKSESESESESENENENGRQPILTTHQDYFRRIQVYFHYLKKLKRSVDASILPLPELPSNLHIPSCRENV